MTTAVLRMPVTSIVLVVLLLGSQGASVIPLVMIAAAVTMVGATSLDRRPARVLAVEGRGDAELDS